MGLPKVDVQGQTDKLYKADPAAFIVNGTALKDTIYMAGAFGAAPLIRQYWESVKSTVEKYDDESDPAPGPNIWALRNDFSYAFLEYCSRGPLATAMRSLVLVHDFQDSGLEEIKRLERTEIVIVTCNLVIMALMYLFVHSRISGSLRRGVKHTTQLMRLIPRSVVAGAPALREFTK